MPSHRIVHRSLVFLTLAILAACSDKDSPEQQVRAVIEQVERAAEDRDVKAHLSQDYRDANGMGAEEAARYVRGYFIANQSIHLLTRIEELTFPTEGEARARVLVGMMGRESAAADRSELGELAGELRTFKLALRREDGEWKVTFLEVMRN